MKWTRLLLLGWSMLPLLPRPVPAQPSLTMTRILTLDSIGMPMATPSPDGRWIVYRSPTQAGSRLHIVARDGASPQPLTSDGFDDFVPRWFPSGDRIVFVSTRANRNGARHRYAMVLDIDSRTGRAVGGPRQVTTENTVWAAGSPDGRFVAYTAQASQRDTVIRVKLVPTAGGLPRTLGEFRIGADQSRNFGVIFDATGRYVYTLISEGPAQGPRSRLWRLPVAGGRPEVVAEADHPVHVLPADPRYLMHVEVPQWPHLGSGTVTLRSVDGKAVARVTVPRFVRPVGATSDGWGFSGIMNRSSGELRVANVATGEVRVLARGDHWAEAWTPDGSAVITDRPVGEAGDYILESIDLAGRVRSSTRLAERHEAGGWKSSVGPYYSYYKPGSGLGSLRRVDGSLHAVDVRDGRTREISRTVAGNIDVAGRAGFENDGDRWVFAEREGDRIHLKAADPATGDSRLIRTLPASTPRLGAFQVHGDRVAWFEPRGDSARLVMTDGPRGPVRHLTTVLMGGDNGGIDAASWSWSGDRFLAITRGILTVLEVPAAAGEAPRRRDIPLALRYCCDYAQWLSDDSGVVGIGREVEGGPVNAYFIPLREGGQPRLIAEVGDNWEILLSPDGKHIAYKVDGPPTSSMWVASFREAVREGR